MILQTHFREEVVVAMEAVLMMATIAVVVVVVVVVAAAAAVPTRTLDARSVVDHRRTRSHRQILMVRFCHHTSLIPNLNC